MIARDAARTDSSSFSASGATRSRTTCHLVSNIASSRQRCGQAEAAPFIKLAFVHVPPKVRVHDAHTMLDLGNARLDDAAITSIGQAPRA